MKRAVLLASFAAFLASCGQPSVPAAPSGTGTGTPAPLPPAAYERARFSGSVRDFLPGEMSVSGEASVSRCAFVPSTKFSAVSESGAIFRPGDVVMVNYGARFGGKEMVPVLATNYGSGNLSDYRVDPKDAARLFLGKVVSADGGKMSVAGTDGKIRAIDFASVPDSVTVSSVRPASLPAGTSALLDCRRLPGGAWEAESVTAYLPAPAPLK